MRKKICTILIAAGLVFGLAACSSLPIAGASATAQPAQQQNPSQNQAGQNPGNMPIQGMLAMGTLTLEGSETAVTAEQAKELLPLWKAVKSLSASTTTSQDELTAVYQQIQETMTEQQVQAIKDMKLSQEDTQALMKKYGIEVPQIDPSRLATRQASAGQNSGGAQSGGNGGFQAGGGSGGDIGMGGGPGGAMPPDGGFQGGQMPNAQGTPQAGRTPRAGGFRGGMNTLFVEPLIKLLEERAGA